MKKLLLAGFCLALAACDNAESTGPGRKSVSLVSAHLDAPGDSILVDEPVRLEPKLVFSGEADSSLLKVTWSITRNGDSLQLEDKIKNVLDWIPTQPGTYAAHATVEYGEKTVEIYVLILVLGHADALGLEAIRKAAVGKWKGTVTTPWIPKYRIAMELRADGTYSDRMDSGEDVTTSPLYYDTEEDSTVKTWSLDDVKANGEATGEIRLLFPLVYSTTLDELRHFRLGVDGKTLSFDMWHFREYGPVHVELNREP